MTCYHVCMTVDLIMLLRGLQPPASLMMLHHAHKQKLYLLQRQHEASGQRLIRSHGTELGYKCPHCMCSAVSGSGRQRDHHFQWSSLGVGDASPP